MFTMVPYRRFLTAQPEKVTNTIFSDPFFRSFFNMAESASGNGFKVDIREKEDAYLIEAELPGVAEDQINLTVEDNMLTISTDILNEKSEEYSNCYYSERRSGHVERSFNLEGIATQKIEAHYRNGILFVTLPKEKPIEKSVRKIAIQNADDQKANDSVSVENK